MIIELVYIPSPETNHNHDIVRKNIELTPDARIEDILPLFSAKGLAIWYDDEHGGMINGNYHSSGILNDKSKYLILSNNIKETINKLHAYHD